MSSTTIVIRNLLISGFESCPLLVRNELQPNWERRKKIPRQVLSVFIQKTTQKTLDKTHEAAHLSKRLKLLVLICIYNFSWVLKISSLLSERKLT